MHILILGGTRFLGRALVDTALDRGHTLTLFNRGKTNPHLYPHIEKLYGERDGGLEPLKGRIFDAVIDTCGYYPRIVKQSAEMLKKTVRHYTFISSVSAYADLSQSVDESSPLAVMEDITVEEITEHTYGPLKVLCEQAVENVFPGPALIIRPGYIVGPHDPTDRFTWWPHRVAIGGEMLCPGVPECPVQVIDVRDLADWVVRMVEDSVSGVFNAVGPQIAMGTLLTVCRKISGSLTTFTWVSEKFIAENIKDTSRSFPLWVPASERQYAGVHNVSAAQALAHGLTCRDIANTVRATLAWERTRPATHTWQTGLLPEQEARLLNQWSQHNDSQCQTP